MGHAVMVLAGEPGAKIPRSDQINGVQVIRWPTQAPDNAYHMPLAADRLREVAIRLAKEADVIHVHNIHAVLPIYVLNAASNLQIRKVVTPYHHGTGHTPIRKLLWTYWRRHIHRLITTTDAAHAVPKSEAQLIQQDFGRHAPRPRPAGRRGGRAGLQAVPDVGRRPALPNGRRSQKPTG